MKLEKLIDLGYLFHRYPPGGFSWPIRVSLLFIFVAALALAIYAGTKIKNLSGHRKKLWRKIQIWGWTTSLVGLLLVYFREVRAIYLSARAYLLLWIIIVLIWIILIIVFHKKNDPDHEEMSKKKEEYEKWLPKQKK